MQKLHLKIAVSSTMRAKIAEQILIGLYEPPLLPSGSKITLSVGVGENSLRGTGSPVRVGTGEFDLAFANPSAITHMAYLGRGPYPAKIPIRTIAVFPSWDRLVFAVSKKVGGHSLEEIVTKKIPLRLSTRRRWRYSHVLCIVDEVLKASGWGLKELKGWGGTIVEVSHPGEQERLDGIRSGKIDTVFDEGIKSWGNAALEAGMEFLVPSDKVFRRIERLGFRRAPMPQKRFPLLPEGITAIDFGGWPIFCSAKLPSDVAYAVVQAIERRQNHIPVDSGCLKLSEICRDTEEGPLDVPLHPGAKRFYEEKGYLA
jgi:hypothetical protein